MRAAARHPYGDWVAVSSHRQQRQALAVTQQETYPSFDACRSLGGDLMIDLHSLRIGERVTMRYPNGLLQEAVLVGNDAGMLNFHVGDSFAIASAPLSIYFSTEPANGAWGRSKTLLTWGREAAT
jgi:hypothetical protein